jgi:hypothetical protein
MSRAAEIEAKRILGEYRRLVLLGKVRVPLAEGRKLVGPDCAFHLYFRHAAQMASTTGGVGRKGRATRANAPGSGHGVRPRPRRRRPRRRRTGRCR